MPVQNKEDLMFKLDLDFIEKSFRKISKMFNGDKEASRVLNMPLPSFRARKYRKFNSLPKKILDSLLDYKIISKEELKNNALGVYHKMEQIKESLDAGRQFRREQLKKWREEIPKLDEIFQGGILDFEKWFFAYKNLINFGARKFNYIKIEKDFIKISYHTHSNKIRKEFILRLPKRIIVDEEFLYFFGLWVGDKAGGGRFGIMNKEEKIVNFTIKYLKKLYQNPEIVLYTAKSEQVPKGIRISKVVRIIQKIKGYAFSTHAINGILVTFFNYLESNLNEFLYKINKFNIFFSGLFDAEGNIFLEDSCFRWACENKTLIPIFKEHLIRLDLFRRYDGANFVSYNKETFSSLILPYIIHPKKINNSRLVCFGNGKLEERFIEILEAIKENPGITNNELSKVLKRKKSYAQITVLEKLGYIYSKNYPKQLFMNSKLNIANKQ